MANFIRPCPCGANENSSLQFDARAIPLCYTCRVCHDEKMRRYRPEVLTDPGYYADEQIEED